MTKQQHAEFIAELQKSARCMMDVVFNNRIYHTSLKTDGNPQIKSQYAKAMEHASKAADIANYKTLGVIK